MEKTKNDYETYLNDLFYGVESFMGYLVKQSSDLILLKQGKYGTVLRHNDPESFEQGFENWKTLF